MFDLLPALGPAHDRTYDFIVLDPPAFTKSRKTIKQRLAWLTKGVNYRAMTAAARRYLATCSCSHFMDTERFKRNWRAPRMTRACGCDRSRSASRRPTTPRLGRSEIDYLKFFIFQVV